MGVVVFPITTESGTGCDVRITSSQCTVEEYVQALSGALEHLSLARLWSEGRDCLGCDLCCAERIPVTWPDLVRLTRIEPEVDLAAAGTGFNNTLTSVFRRCFSVYVNGSFADIVLKRTEAGRCIFLSRKGTCEIYPLRPFVCRTFICCPLSARARRLREVITNAGQDELVRWWLHQVKKGEIYPWFDEADDPCLDTAAWKTNPFSRKTKFSEVLIKDLVSDRLWNTLTQ